MSQCLVAVRVTPVTYPLATFVSNVHPFAPRDFPTRDPLDQAIHLGGEFQSVPQPEHPPSRCLCSPSTHLLTLVYSKIVHTAETIAHGLSASPRSTNRSHFCPMCSALKKKKKNPPLRRSRRSPKSRPPGVLLRPWFGSIRPGLRPST